MIGTKVGKWEVLSIAKVEQNRPSVFRYFLCRCECGIEKAVRADGLKKGKSTQCEDCRKKEKYIDTEAMIGMKFGRWLAIAVGPNKKLGQRQLLCRCECGKELNIPASVLKLGKNNSCHMCNVKKHGYDKTPTYNTWRCMLARCNKTDNDNYHRYGGRGIKVCDRWYEFKNFLEDMGERPDKLQLDRIDSDGNYDKENCRWVTAKENSNNRVHRNQHSKKS